MRPPAILAVDGGGSKVDAALVRRDGTVLAAARVRNGDSTLPPRRDDGDGDRRGASATGRDRAFDDMLTMMSAAVGKACARAGIDASRGSVAAFGAFCLAGADLPADDRRIATAIRRRGWVDDSLVRNDTFAILRAGTERRWGVAVVCGYGTNCSAVAPDGSVFRFPALGALSGDWGGAADIGAAGLWHAIRAKDGRGPATTLAERVPRWFGMTRPRQLMEAIHFGRIGEDRLADLAPVVFAAAIDGDAVARSIIDRQADEVIAMASAAIRRLRMSALDVDVVLGGGIFRNEDAAFFERVGGGLATVAPRMRLVVLAAPPVVGAALMGLDHVGGGRNAVDRVRRSLTDERLAADTGSAGEG
jgi:N-acetylglucosamine kinase-like BadF-type ATPase